MKTSLFRERTYLLVGNFEAKYCGEKTEDSNDRSTTDFKMTIYEAVLRDAYIIDASFLPCLVDQDIYQDLPLLPLMKIFRKNNDQVYWVTPDKTWRIFQPKISNVSQQGTEVNGTLNGITAVPVKDIKMAFNPISIPVFEIQGNFPGFQDAPVKSIPEQKKKMSIDFKEIFEVFALIFNVLMAFAVAFAVFSSIHPIILLVLAGIVSFALVLKAIPGRFGISIFNGLKKIVTLIFYAGGILLLLGFGILLLGNFTAFVFFWIPMVVFFLLMDYLTKFSWLILRNAGILAIIVLALSLPILFSAFTGNANPAKKAYDPVPRVSQITSPNNILVESILPDTVNQQLIHTITWQDFDTITHSITYPISQTDNLASQMKREQVNIPIQGYRDFEFLFSQLLENESTQIGGFISQLDSIRRHLNLNEMDFANLIVSLVQQIDYSLLNENGCPTSTPLPCRDKVKYGVYTPTEFLFSLKGDCDTKSLLLYLLFDKFGYDVALLGSLSYQHSMIALKLPGNGDGLNIQNQMYYVWEVTSPGWKFGIMPSENNLLQFWEPILINNQNLLQ